MMSSFLDGGATSAPSPTRWVGFNLINMELQDLVISCLVTQDALHPPAASCRIPKSTTGAKTSDVTPFTRKKIKRKKAQTAPNYDSKG